MWGFDNPKDFVEVLLIPFVLLAIGIWLPVRLEKKRAEQMRSAFLSLIRRELQEMNPDAEDPQPDGKWFQHLKKRFIHQAIFEKPSDNRDFILSLEPDLAYSEAQLWMHFDKATKSKTKAKEELAVHGNRWCDYLSRICLALDGNQEVPLYESVCRPWQRLVASYHPPSG